MNTRPYVITLKFGIWENQLWLEADASEQTEQAWEIAKAALDDIAKSCSTSSEYFGKAIEHFAARGFDRIQK